MSPSDMTSTEVMAAIGIAAFALSESIALSPMRENSMVQIVLRILQALGTTNKKDSTGS